MRECCTLLYFAVLLGALLVPDRPQNGFAKAIYPTKYSLKKGCLRPIIWLPLLIGAVLLAIVIPVAVIFSHRAR